jgi:hypothetical protein
MLPLLQLSHCFQADIAAIFDFRQPLLIFTDYAMPPDFRFQLLPPPLLRRPPHFFMPRR